MTSWTFSFCLAFLISHELDAVTAKEWRILPGLSLVDDKAAEFWFVALHVPLSALLLLGLLGPNQASWIRGIDLFAIAHAGAHLAYLRDPRNGFGRPLSWLLIGGAAAMGGLDLLLRLGS